MYKRILVLLLLCVSVFFSSCSSKKRSTSYNSGDYIILPDTEKTYSEKISYEKYLKKNYEMQPESAKKLIKDNKKRRNLCSIFSEKTNLVQIQAMLLLMMV